MNAARRLRPIDIGKPRMRGWLRDNSQSASGRLVGDFTGQGPSESAYLLIDDATGKRRVVVVGHGAIRYDAIFDKVAGIGRVSGGSIDRVEWELKPQGEPNGGFYISARTADEICARGEVYAYSGFAGFPARTFDSYL